jgi:hypothetical protein
MFSSLNLFDQGSPNHPSLSIGKGELGGVISGHVLEQTGKSIEPEATAAVDIGPPNLPRTPENPSHRRDREQFLGPVGTVNDGVGGGHKDDATGRGSPPRQLIS